MENINELHDGELNIAGCDICGGDIKYEEKEGRGLPPKGWVRKRGDHRKISWQGIWDISTCSKCGNVVKKLRPN